MSIVVSVRLWAYPWVTMTLSIGPTTLVPRGPQWRTHYPSFAPRTLRVSKVSPPPPTNETHRVMGHERECAGIANDVPCCTPRCAFAVHLTKHHRGTGAEVV